MGLGHCQWDTGKHGWHRFGHARIGKGAGLEDIYGPSKERRDAHAIERAFVTWCLRRSGYTAEDWIFTVSCVPVVFRERSLSRLT